LLTVMPVPCTIRDPILARRAVRDVDVVNLLIALIARTIDPMRARTWSIAALGIALGCSGCESCSSEHHDVPVTDAGPCDSGDCDPPLLDGSAANEDAGQDSGLPGDAGLDGGMDAAVDAGIDDASVMDATVGGDAGEDAAVDGGEDAGVDAAVPCVDAGAEVCNGIDDDCDGRSDEELLEMSADDSLSFDMPVGESLYDGPDGGTSPNDERGFSQLLPRTSTTAWLLHKALAPSDAASSLNVSTLDQTGALVGTTQTGLVPTGRIFLGASLGEFLAVLWRDTDADMDSSVADLVDTTTHLTLFEAVSDVLTERASVELGGPADISELELQRDASGNLRLFTAYAPWSITGNTAAERPTVLHHFRYDESGTPALVEVAETTLPGNARPTVHVLPRPCGTGWLIAYWTNNGMNNAQVDRELYVRAMTLDGVVDLEGAPLFQVGGHGLQGFASAPQCARDSSPMLLIADSPQEAGVQNVDAYEFEFEHDDGSILEVNSVVVVNRFAFTRIARYGGQWYVTLRNFDDTPTGVFEVDAVNQRVRNIGTPPGDWEQGGLAQSGISRHDANMYFIPTHGIVRAGQGMLVTFSNAKPETSRLGGETIAVTHRLGCPQD
jgi:hypothetical protein